jgi:aromatic-L-amino-acid/L-tryptophan decarboxylase
LDPLELPPERMRELGHAVVDLLVDRWRDMAAQPVWQPGSPARLEAALAGPAPETPGDFALALDRLITDVLPHGARIDHPRFMAFVPGVPTWPGVLGDLLAAGTNVFQGTWLASAGVSALELVVIDWFRDWLGCSATTSGLLVSGGSVANLTAIACARLDRFEGHDSSAVIYASTEVHSSVLRAARILGFGPDRIRHIAVDDGQRLALGSLDAAISADRAAGLTPFLVVATAGTTSTGAIDPLHETAELCRMHGAWLHVDAAYGGFAALTHRGRAALSGIELADSIALDPHKWLYQPFEAGCLLVRDATALDRAFHVLPAYLQDTALDDGGAVNFANRGIQLTRSARVLKIWLSVQTFGLHAFREAIDRCIDLALHAERRIRDHPALEVLSPARLGIVCFRIRADEERVDAINRAALDALLNSGAGMISSTRVNGVFALRLCVLNYRTRAADVDAVIAAIAGATVSAPGATVSAPGTRTRDDTPRSSA